MEHSLANRRLAAETQLLEGGYEVEHGQIRSAVKDDSQDVLRKTVQLRLSTQVNL